MKLKPVPAATPAVALELVGPKQEEISPLAPTTLVIRPRWSEGGVTAKIARLVVVSGDLSWMELVACKERSDGVLEGTIRFPTPGRFVVFADIAEAGKPVASAPLELVVRGKVPTPAPLKPDPGSGISSEGYLVRLDKHEPIRAQAESVLSFSITKDGKPVSDSETSAATLVMVPQKLDRIIVAHAEAGSGSGPAFKVKSLEPGVYAAWIQFRTSGKEVTPRIVIEVKP
jgi:hypothetical protein